MSDVFDLLAGEGVRIKAGRYGDFKMTCPQCSATRRNKSDPCLSVTVKPGDAVYNCHHCGWTGGVKEKDNSYERFTPKTIAPVKTPEPMGDDRAMFDWFLRRGISEETVRQAGIIRTEKYMMAEQATVPVYSFPYFKDGKVVNHKYRSSKKQFQQDKGALKVFYGLEKTGDATEVFIVEGEIDALSFREIGYNNVWSVPDGSPKNIATNPDDMAKKFSFLQNCEDEIKKIDRFIIATDSDGPGQAMAEELSRRLGKDKCWKINWPEGRKDANEVLANDGGDYLQNAIENAKPWPIDDLHTVEDYADEVMGLYHTGRARAFSTGWHCIDKIMTIEPGQLSVVTGIPNSGKSEFVDALMVNMAEQHGWRFAICSFENPPADHIIKIIEKRMRLPFTDRIYSKMSVGEVKEGMAWANDHFHFLRVSSEKNIPTLDWALERFGAAVRNYGVKGIVLDPWNEVEHQRPNNMTETEYIGQCLMKIKRFAALRGVHVWVVAHPAKMHSDTNGVVNAPGLYDISGSANWANKADLGVVVHRNDAERFTEIHVKKCRFKHIGQKGMEPLNYDVATGRYAENGFS